MSTNEEKVEFWKDRPWYPAIKRANDRLSQEIPGYTIDLIKEKFGGLRYHYSLPDELNTEEYRARADRIISHAEGWVEGYTHREKERE